MTPPASPETATSDDQVIAWTLKHSTDAERRAMATDLGASYPSDVSILGTTCDKGHGYVGVWVINFVTTTATWNVTLDGHPYAGAEIRPQSVDYGAIAVPNGHHTVAFVNPSTGAVAARISTNLTCGTSTAATTPSTSKPATSTTRPATSATAPVSKPAATATPAATSGAKPAAPAPSTMGPRVQTDSASSSTGVSGALATVLIGAIGGSLVMARRFMRV